MTDFYVHSHEPGMLWKLEEKSLLMESGGEKLGLFLNTFQTFSSVESSLSVTSVDTKVPKNRKKKARMYFGKILFKPS